MRIYVAGPMRGRPQFNFPTFNAVTKYLRDQGHDVFNPAERDIEMHGAVPFMSSETGDMKDIEHTGLSVRDVLAFDLGWLCRDAEAILMLPGWETSMGATAEWAAARAVGMKIIYTDEMEIADMM